MEETPRDQVKFRKGDLSSKHGSTQLEAWTRKKDIFTMFQILEKSPTAPVFPWPIYKIFYWILKEDFCKGLALCPFPIGWNADTMGALAAFFILSIFCIALWLS